MSSAAPLPMVGAGSLLRVESSTLCWQWGHNRCQRALSCRSDGNLKRRSHITIKVAGAAEEVERWHALAL